MTASSRFDFVISTLTASEVGSLESVVSKLRQVQNALRDMEQPALASRADDAIAALERGDVAEFKRIRAFIQAKVGHLR